MAGKRDRVEGLPWYRAARAVGVGVDVDSMDQIDTSSLVDRARCVVTELPANAVYEYDQDSAAVADGFNVVAPTSGVGRWVLVSVTGAEAFITQASWFVDPVTGDDTNDGATALTALQTLPELGRRLNFRPFLPSLVALSVTLAAGTYPDPLALYPVLPAFGQLLTIAGTMTQDYAGTITGFTAWNSGAGTRSALTDAAANFTALKQKRLRLTSGANSGALSSFGSIAAADTCHPNSFSQPSSGSTVTPVVGDGFVVETPATIVPGVQIEVFGQGLTLLRDMRYNLVTPGQRFYASSTGGTSRLRVAGIEWTSTTSVPLVSGNFNGLACYATGTFGPQIIPFSQLSLNAQSFYHDSVAQVSGTGDCIGNNWMHDGDGTVDAALFITNGARLEDTGTQAGHAFFGCAGASALVSVDDGGLWVLSQASCRFWGAAGNTATNALRVSNGSGFVYITLPTATGATPGNDVVLAGGAAAAWGAMPAVGVAPNNAYVLVRQ
jgi:hypothetical protein